MIGVYVAQEEEDFLELGDVRPGAVRGVVGRGGFGACNLGCGA